jgi:hypothetical protein
MAHDPRVFVGPQQSPDGSGHLLHVISANSPHLGGIVQQGLRELTAAEYAAWDSGDRTHKAIEAHGR